MQDEEPREIAELLAKLVREPLIAFPAPGERLEASDRKGVYVIYSPQNKVVHVGSTPHAKEGVAQRLRNHLNGKSSFTKSQFAGDGSRLRHGYKFRYLEAIRKQYEADWETEHPLAAPFASKLTEEVETYIPPPGYNDTVDHEANFFNAVRSRKPCFENEVFGNNAAIGCHLANYSYFNKKIATWDAAAKKITG